MQIPRRQENIFSRMVVRFRGSVREAYGAGENLEDSGCVCFEIAQNNFPKIYGNAITFVMCVGN
jgi:hypothetical protein